jgi:capsular polysaccharide biosynthesis protein
VRVLTNAAEAEAAALAAGYTIVQPERMGFFDQARLFSQASHVVGATGAWAANLLFVPQDARIDIFYPETARVEKAVWSAMAEALQMQATPVYCPVTLLRPEPFTIQSDFMIPIDLLNGLLRQDA